MKERPILFSGEMVKALLAGTKTQTRRVVKPQPVLSPNGAWWHWPRLGGIASWTADRRPSRQSFMSEALFEKCPYGQPGERLWVRETWVQNAFDELLYRADMEGYETRGMGWKSGIHMPRWASRITLEITNVRVERLKDMRLADVEAEGIDGPNYAQGETWEDAIERYAALWDDLNAKRGYSWSSSPWVWVVTFKKVTS